MVMYSHLDLTRLGGANKQRQLEYDPDGKLDNMYNAVELGGECGEVLNVVKKLARMDLGLPGSKETVDHLAEELGDVVICASLLANAYNIDLAEATKNKFNATSAKLELQTIL